MNLLSRFGLNGMLLALLAFTVMFSLTVGPVPITTEDVLKSLWINREPYSVIVDQIRLPRVLLAMLVGASLGLSGAALQGLLRNPLAEPGLLGVSTSASLGAVLSLYFGLVLFSPWMLPMAAMTGAAIATLILYLIARGGASSLTLILSGVALSSLSGALTSLAINLAPTPTDLQDIVLWLLGSLSDRSYEDIRLCLPFVVVGMAMLLATGRQLNALTLGEDEASSLGINLSQLRGQVVVGTALSVGACVAVAGSIGFVGLVVPHMLRRFVQFHPSRLLFSSALGGALLLLLADTLLRLIHGNQEIMLGVVTALIGAPFFLVLVLRSRKRAL
jgi:iron complex transport system permease protein